jgi:hypothetical protein
MSIASAKTAKQLSEENFSLAEKLYKENIYHDWVVIALFYAACLLIHSICEIRSLPIPERHRGRFDKQANRYTKGLLDIAKEQLSTKSFSSYSLFLVESQVLRYRASDTIAFKKSQNVRSILDNRFAEFDIILRDFEGLFGKYL